MNIKQPTFAHALFSLPVLATGICALALAAVFALVMTILFSVDWKMLVSAFVDTLCAPFQHVGYMFHNLRTYTQNLFVKEDKPGWDAFEDLMYEDDTK